MAAWAAKIKTGKSIWLSRIEFIIFSVWLYVYWILVKNRTRYHRTHPCPFNAVLQQALSKVHKSVLYASVVIISCCYYRILCQFLLFVVVISYVFAFCYSFLLLL